MFSCIRALNQETTTTTKTVTRSQFEGGGGSSLLSWYLLVCLIKKLIAKKKENNTPDSHLVPHGSTKGASSGLASKFGMGFGALRSLWSISSKNLNISYKYLKVLDLRRTSYDTSMKEGTIVVNLFPFRILIFAMKKWTCEPVDLWTCVVCWI